MRETDTIRRHHPFSSSSLQSREACAKYRPRSTTNEAAEAGTRQHSSADSEKDDPRLTDAQAFAVAQCVEYTKQRAALYPGGTVLKEEYLPIDDELLEIGGEIWKGTSAGFIDFAVISADETSGELIDYKYGKWGVESAANNVQGICYSLGLKKRFPKLRRLRVTFQMPHRDEVSTHEFDLSNPAELYLRVVTIVRRAIEAGRDPDDFSMATPTLGSCIFCDLIGRCPKVADFALRIGKKFNPLTIPESIIPSLILDPEQAGLGLKLAMVVATWADAYKRQATSKTIEDADFIPSGYKLVTTTRRSVVNARQVGELAKNFVPADQHDAIESLYDIALTPLEKLIALSAPRGLKEKTVEEFGEAVEAAGAVEKGQPFAFLRQDAAK